MNTLTLWLYDKKHHVTFKVSRYENMTLCIDVITHINGFPEWLMHLTTEINTYNWANHTFIDTKTNGDGIIYWLASTGLGQPTGRKKTKNGYDYPEVRFNLSMLRKYNGHDEIFEYDGDYKAMKGE